jgi:iron complex outermembrane receptor protein
MIIMKRSRSVGGAVALALTCAAPAVHAQQAAISDPLGGTVGLPTVTVDSTSETECSLTVPSVAEQRQQMEQVVGSTAFVDAAAPAIQTRFIQDIPQALKDVPGVYAESR